ncbi:hypothetical protein [Nocardia sp. NPDC004123]
MPHDNSTDTPNRVDDEWGWLDDQPPLPLPTITETQRSDSEAEWSRLDRDARHRTPGATGRARPNRSARRWIGPVLTTAVAAVVITTAVLAMRSNAQQSVTVSQTVASATTRAPLRSAACAGLSATTITDGAGDTTSVAGVIAAFEYAYYQQRSPDAAMRLLASDAGIALEPLTAGIASIPAGTTHCVAITPITDNTANVHLVELHLDRTRTDYLQVINLHHIGTGLLISNIQKQG